MEVNPVTVGRCDVEFRDDEGQHRPDSAYESADSNMTVTFYALSVVEKVDRSQSLMVVQRCERPAGLDDECHRVP